MNLKIFGLRNRASILNTYLTGHYQKSLIFTSQLNQIESSRLNKSAAIKSKQEFPKNDYLNFNKSHNLQGESGKNETSIFKNKRPTNEQLILVRKAIENYLPKFFKSAHPYNLYHKDMVFENAYTQPATRTIGITKYALQLLYIRFKVNLKYSRAQLDALKITHDETEGTIKIRWRINAIGGAAPMTQPWMLKLWNVKGSIKEKSEWIDGFSILYIGSDGLIHKHLLQRVMTQKDEEKVKNDNKLGIKNLQMEPTICSK